MTNNSEVRFYVDTMIVETLLSNEGLSKKADSSGMITSLIDSVKNYVGGHIRPDDKVGSVLDILAPGAISVMFSSLGLGWLGVLLGMAMRVFNVDVKGIISTIYGKVKSALTSGQPLNSSQVDNMVFASVQQHAGTEDAQVKSSLRDAKLIKLAMISYDAELNGFKSEAAPRYGSRGKVVGILGMVLGWIFKVSLASAGLMVAGDVVNKVLNRPNALDGTLQKGKPVEQSEQSVPTVVSKQTKFPLKAGYTDTKYNSGTSWIEKVNNSQSGIENMIISFVKEVYDGLDGLDNVIKSSPLFKATVDNIAWYNHTAAGDPVVFIPKFFTSKKQLVDHFIDDIAARSGQAPTTPPSGDNSSSIKFPTTVPKGQYAL